MDTVLLWHPDTDTYYEAPESSVRILAASGWQVCDDATIARRAQAQADAAAAADAAMTGTPPATDPAAGAADTIPDEENA